MHNSQKFLEIKKFYLILSFNMNNKPENPFQTMTSQNSTQAD